MSSVRFAIGVAIMLLGYAALYSGQSMMKSGGHGVPFLQALGINGVQTFGTTETLIRNGKPVDPGSDVPNLSGNTPQTAPPPQPGIIQGQFYFGP